MYVYLLSILTGLVAGALLKLVTQTWWECILLAIVVSGVSLFLLVKRVNGKVMQLTDAAQQRLMKTQEDCQRKVKEFQNRAGTNPEQAMKVVTAMQHEGVRAAIELLKPCEGYYKWNMMVRKQVNMMRYQLYFSIKDFEAADKYERDVIVLDPNVACMLMARRYQQDKLPRGEGGVVDPKVLKEWSVAKMYKKGLGRTRAINSGMIYATYGWILLKQGQEEEALKVFNEGAHKTGDETLKANAEHLRNKRAKDVSNAVYAERWYALHLEEPPKPKQQVIQQRAGKGGRGGPVRYF